MDRRIMFLDVQHDIESNLIHEAERSTMGSKQNLEDTVYLCGCRNPFFDYFERLALHGGPDAVKNEPDALFPDMERNNPVKWQAFHQIRDHRIGGLSARNHFDSNLFGRHVIVRIDDARRLRNALDDLACRV